MIKMIRDLRTKIHLRRSSTMLIGMLTGMILLTFLSYLQKIIIGAPVSLKGFVIPSTYGGFIGALLGYIFFLLLRTISKLTESESKYRSLFEGSLDGCLLLDSKFTLLSTNPRFQEMTGLSGEELIQKRLGDLLFIGSKQLENECSPDKYKESPERAIRFECMLQSSKDKDIPVEVYLSRIFIDMKEHFWSIVHDISDRKMLDKKVYEAIIRSEENERSRYAKELHDGLGPILSTAMIYLTTLQNETDKKLIKEYQQRSYELMEDALRCVKDISNNISPEILSRYGLEQALRSFIGKVQPVSDIHFLIRSTLKCRLSSVIEFTIYRTLIELLNNSIKYADAGKIEINLEIKESILQLEYRDNGKGFDYEDIKNRNKGFGLMNLESRIQKIGGHYNYFTRPKEGTRVNINIQTECV